MRRQKGKWIAGLGLLVLGLSACEQSYNASGLTATSTATPTPISGSKAAKIIFKDATSGSFDSANWSSNVISATRIFNADGSALANTTTLTSTWPSWLSSVKIGTNSSSANSCFGFASSDEEAGTGSPNPGGYGNCILSGGDTTSYPHRCGAQTGYLRVSEKNCLDSGVAAGTGASSDPVYIRVTLDRTQLGATENMMAVLEYQPSGISEGPSDPSNCFSGGVFVGNNPACSNMSWQAYAKHTVSESVLPFLMLAPPYGYIDTTYSRRVNGSVQTRQIILPLSSDSSLSILQLSRTTNGTPTGLSVPGVSGTVTVDNFCDDSTPLCLGVIFYSLTLYRI